MKKIELKEIQNEEKNILKILIHYLKEHNIKYYIWGGTFLGAVRHKGFIPWDDDIDIAIPRPEYNKLIEIIKKEGLEIDKNIQFAGFEVGDLDYPFIKVINKNIMIKDMMQWDKHLWVDVFPLDGVPNKHKIYYKIRKIKKHIYNLYRYKFNNFPMNKNNLLEKIKLILFKFIDTKNYNRQIKKYIDYCSKYKYDSSEYICDNVWCGNIGYSLKKDKIEESEEYDFEGLKVNGFKNYDYILKEFYGDYMKLPPEDKRITHEFEAWRVEEDDKEIKE